jgi:N-acetylmuramoyl-L-alanine amidase
MKLLSFFSFLVLTFCVKNVYAFTGGDDEKIQKKTLKRIVIDPGHGGYPTADEGNYGASSDYGDEKDIALAVALKLQKDLQEQLPDVDVYLTRTTDVFESVRTKAEKANAVKGDLFISLHCDGVDKTYSRIIGYTHRTVKRNGKKKTIKIPVYRNRTVPDTVPKGASTLIWNIGYDHQKEDAVANDEQQEATDSSENSIINYINDPVRKMEIALRMRQYFERSNLLAQTIQDEFEKAGRINRGVWQRQMGIWVLAAVNMPAVMVEMGFLSNDEEAQYLASETGQQETADEITEAIKRYKFSLDKKLQMKDSTTIEK